MTATMEMPKYRCHKEVWALKIAAIEFDKNGKAKIAPDDPGYAVLETTNPFNNQFRGSEDDLGYYVVYKDGYVSWSPSAAFEDGYSRI